MIKINSKNPLKNHIFNSNSNFIRKLIKSH